MVAAAIAVSSLWSYEGDTSTTSIPIILMPLRARNILSTLSDVNPPHTGVPVPGANADLSNQCQK